MTAVVVAMTGGAVGMAARAVVVMEETEAGEAMAAETSVKT